MGSSWSHLRRRSQHSEIPLLLVCCLLLAAPASATKGVFQGRVVEGNKREAGKYIYIEGRAGYMRRVNIQSCRVQFAPNIPSSQRSRSASESLHESAQVRVTAEQKENGEWVATEIVILKVAELDSIRLRI